MMDVRLNRKIGKAKAFVFTLCACSTRNLTFMFFGVVVAQQLISASIEFLLFGEAFPHWIDSAFFITASCSYLYFLYELGDFLLDIAMNGKEDK